MNRDDVLSLVAFLKLPDGFKFSCRSFELNPAIRLPVRFESKEEMSRFDIGGITEEMILAGILTVLAYDDENADLPYYRAFLKAARPKIREELTQMAILKAKEEDFALAEEIFSALRALNPSDAVTILNCAVFFDEYADFYRKGGLLDDADAYDKKAEHFYDLACEGDAVLPDAFFNAGFFFQKKRDFSKAKSMFESFVALSAGESDDDGRKNLDVKLEKACEQIRRIESLSLDDEAFCAAYDAISDGDAKAGIEKIKGFLERNPKNPNAWFVLGWGLRKAKRFSAAESAFKKSIECGMEGGDVWNELSICQTEAQDFAAAEKSLSKAIEIDGENVKFISNMGFLALKRGREDAARRYFLATLEFAPDDIVAQTALKSLE